MKNKSKKDIRLLDKELEAFMYKWKIKGGTVALVKNNKLIYSKGFGHTNHEAPMPSGAILRIASLSKPITAIAILKLAEEQKLRLDDKVFGFTGILNDPLYAHMADPRMAEITVKHLLQHTGGWDRDKSAEGDPMFNPFHISEVMGKSGPADQYTVITYMLSKPLDFDPGSRYAYSNLGYNILGRVIEKLSGTTYSEFVQHKIFIPLGMHDMQLAKNADLETNASISAFVNIEAMDAHGGWKASASDLAKLLVALGPGSPYHLLTEESRKLMLKGTAENPNYGLGWFINDKGSCWHTGSLNDCTTFMARMNSGVCAVMLFNTRPDNPEYFIELDKVMWTGMKKVKIWPEKDFFRQHNHQTHSL